jgi:dimethylargininase
MSYEQSRVVMTFADAILRTPGSNLEHGLTTTESGVPDYALALAQHTKYAEALECAGLHVTILEPLSAFPDAYFVEDVAVVTAEVAVITRPGAETRRGEEAFIEPVLAKYRPIARIVNPATLDGGDVLIAGRRVVVGLTDRTNPEGARQLRKILSPHGYQVVGIPVSKGLHLKSSVNLIGQDVLLVTREFAHHDALVGFRLVVVEEGDEYSANVLWVNDHILVPAGYPRTCSLLEPLERQIVELDMSEMRKMDGGLTCLSLRLGDRS